MAITAQLSGTRSAYRSTTCTAHHLYAKPHLLGDTNERSHRMIGSCMCYLLAASRTSLQQAGRPAFLSRKRAPAVILQIRKLHSLNRPIILAHGTKRSHDLRPLEIDCNRHSCTMCHAKIHAPHLILIHRSIGWTIHNEKVKDRKWRGVIKKEANAVACPYFRV